MNIRIWYNFESGAAHQVGDLLLGEVVAPRAILAHVEILADFVSGLEADLGHVVQTVVAKQQNPSGFQELVQRFGHRFEFIRMNRRQHENQRDDVKRLWLDVVEDGTGRYIALERFDDGLVVQWILLHEIDGSLAEVASENEVLGIEFVLDQRENEIPYAAADFEQSFPLAFVRWLDSIARD